MSEQRLRRAYAHCVALARSHYENFPVASRLLPRRVRLPIAVIYAFARQADDFADEGDLAPQTRLAQLDNYARQLDALNVPAKRDGNHDAPHRTKAPTREPHTVTEDPVFIALADVIERHALPLNLFHDLLHAFRADVTKKRYANFGEVMDYCRHSANPVGRLLLHLHGSATPRNLAHADAVCSALQLINFLQDIEQDYTENNRIYLPQDEMARYGVSEDDIRARRTTPAMRLFMDSQIERARRLMKSGAPLGLALRGRFGLELRLIIMGGTRVLHKLHAARENAYARPRLTLRDGLWIGWQAVTARLRR